MIPNKEKDKQNPANEPLTLPKGYKPMSTGTLRLEVPQKDGWHMHWFRGTPARIARAQQAGYTFVDPSEVDTNNFDIAGDSKESGSTDLGSRVSVAAGDYAENGQTSRMYLMKCPQQLFEHAQGILEKQIDTIAESLRGGTIGKGASGETQRDVSLRYLKDGKVPSLFQKRT